MITRPAFALNPRLDVVAFNRLADEIYLFSGGQGPFAGNFIWRFFSDPVRHALYADWPEAADAAVGLFRASYASRVGDPHFEELIATLNSTSEAFRRTWRRESTISLRPGRGILTSSRRGRLLIDSVRFTMPGLPGHILFVLLPADAATEKAFARLGPRTAANGRPRRNR